RAHAVRAEIAAHAIPQRPRLADVDRGARTIRPEVYARVLGQTADLVLQVFDGHWGNRVSMSALVGFVRTRNYTNLMTFTGFIGKVCMWPLRAIIRASVALGIHPNTLTLIGVLINVAAACALGVNRFLLAGVIMIVANIFDFIDGKVAQQTNTVSRFGAFWDSTLDRFSDIALFLGLLYLYSTLRRTDYVMVAALALTFSIMTSYARARAESLIEKCKVGFMERPERIVLFMIGAFTNRMGAVLWVILLLSIFTVADRIYYPYLVLYGTP